MPHPHPTRQNRYNQQNIRALEQRLCRAAALQLRECANLLRQRQRLAQELERRKGWPERDVVHLRGALDGVRHRLRTMLMTEAEREALARSTYIANLILEGKAEELMELAKEDDEAARPILGVKDRRLQHQLRAIVRQGKPKSILKAFGMIKRGKFCSPARKAEIVGAVLQRILPHAWVNAKGELVPEEPEEGGALVLAPPRAFVKGYARPMSVRCAIKDVANDFGISESLVKKYFYGWAKRTAFWAHYKRSVSAYQRRRTAWLLTRPSRYWTRDEVQRYQALNRDINLLEDEDEEHEEPTGEEKKTKEQTDHLAAHRMASKRASIEAARKLVKAATTPEEKKRAEEILEIVLSERD